MRSRRSVLLSLVLSAFAIVAPAQSPAQSQDRPWLILAEAIPAVGIALPRLDGAPYEEREALANRVRLELVARTAAAIGVRGEEAREVAPGGWMLTTAPSIPGVHTTGPFSSRLTWS